MRSSCYHKCMMYSKNTIENKNRPLNYYISGGLIVVFICMMFLLPARFYITYSLAKSAQSNIVINYLNAVDLVAIMLSILCVILEKKRVIDIGSGKIVIFYAFIVVIELVALAFSAHIEYAGELVSKLVLIIAASIISAYIHNGLDEKLKLMFYIFPLLVLVVASFFLTDYGGYAVSNRVGTLGFGSNETAMFACALIAISLLYDMSFWLKLGFTVVGFACVLTVSSRRGIVVALAIVFLFGIIKLFSKKKKFTKKKLFAVTFAIVLLGIFVYRYYSVIYNYVISSPLVIRLIYTSKTGQSAFDTSDRLDIFHDSISQLNQNPLLGFMGSDKLFAQGSYTHTHNLFLQGLVIYGYLFGLIIGIFFVTVLYKAVKLLIYSHKNVLKSKIGAVYSVFFIVYVVFDMFGYLLWNSKGVFWVMISSFLIIRQYKEAKEQLSAMNDRRNRQETSTES